MYGTHCYKKKVGNLRRKGELDILDNGSSFYICFNSKEAPIQKKFGILGGSIMPSILKTYIDTVHILIMTNSEIWLIDIYSFAPYALNYPQAPISFQFP